MLGLVNPGICYTTMEILEITRTLELLKSIGLNIPFNGGNHLVRIIFDEEKQINDVRQIVLNPSGSELRETQTLSHKEHADMVNPNNSVQEMVVVTESVFNQQQEMNVSFVDAIKGPSKSDVVPLKVVAPRMVGGIQLYQ